MSTRLNGLADAGAVEHPDGSRHSELSIVWNDPLTLDVVMMARSSQRQVAPRVETVAVARG